MKRVLTAVIGLPIIILVFIFANKYVVDVLFSIISIIAMYEFFKALKTENRNKPVEGIGYISCILISLIHVIPQEYIFKVIGLYLILIISLMFMIVLFSKMKIEIKDVALTLFGMLYIIFFIAFIPLLYGMENGKLLVWYIFISAWGTDTFAYLIGIKFGKHKFSKISPKKSLEGCAGGILGAIILLSIYTIFVNKLGGLNIEYWYVIIIGIILSIFSQVGDFSASAIKRSVGIKDFGTIFPGHGGMLDRFDSIIFIAPFAYFLLTLI